MATLAKPTGTATQVATVVAAAGVAVAAVQPLLLTFDALPTWLQDNAFILTGYRRPQYSWSGCARSVFGYLHNESVNIHTHLFGALVLLYLLLNVGKTQAGYTSLTWQDPVGFSLSLMAGIFCLGASALYHTATCHSPNVARRCNALDYSGIIVLTVGSFYPCLRYGFFCDPQYQVIYSIGITVAGLAAAYVVLNPQYSTPAYRWARTSVFFVLGACSFVPIATAYHLYGLERIKNEMGVHWIALTSVFYVGGALIYACRVPERWFPGTFDFFGSSHQIFHVCVVLAALSHYQAVLTGFEYWHGQHHGVCPT
ncbi:hemolysin III family channel protein [Rhizoctonia solani AG-3 Rhs1AP]|uniref:Hemolysin III family channel protein n=2 Tax=Rhizoctonia solani AG-3 TaxID=1086053 RepID=X8JR34_9AGAM|nr:hemolysin III family channel protein [Rhizoctonia solani AG-3 Rhs1AP]KEP46885.1 putative hemolysin-III channel protein Izh2 [Rhizoctonia solani 123E]